MEGDYNKPLVADPEFDRLIPKPNGTIETIKRRAELEDTLEFLPKAMRRVIWQVKKIVPLVKSNSLEETCRKIWTRLYNGIRYCKDDKGKEQIRSPRCTWWGKKGDCDDFSVFVSAILCHLHIPHLFRIAMYKKSEGYQHIYPVAIAPDGREIVIDCVLSRFNKEVPYIQKIDKEMELQFLDGVEDEFLRSTVGSIDAQDLLSSDLGDLGRKKFRDTKVGQAIKKGIHLVNRTNPAATLMRVGVLACMKINMFKIAGNLRYTYLSDEEAKKKGIDMAKFPKLKAIREKLEKIFYAAGGKEENLRKAILTGHGNKNKEVPLSGIGSIEGSNDEQSELPQLLGIETYNSETGETAGLGDPATATAVTAASSAMAALAALIKSLGTFKKGGDTSDTTSADGSTDTSSITDSSNTPAADNSSAAANNKSVDTSAPKNNPANTTNNSSSGGANTTDTPAKDTDESGGGDDSGSDGSQREQKPATTDQKSKEKAAEKLTGFARAKDWISNNKLAAGGIGLAAIGLIGGLTYGINKYMKKSKEKKTEAKTENSGQTVSGVRSKRKRSRAHRKIKVQRLR